jgi:D-xylose transport system substrate-binding protein
VRRSIRFVISALVSVLAAAAVTACGNSVSGGGGGSSSGSGGKSTSTAKVAFLMPDEASTRYELYDHPLFVARMKQLCPTCQVLYQNGNGSASTQQNQMQSVISEGAKVIVLDPVDATALSSSVQQALSRGIKVISYDRPFPKLHTAFYVSFNNERIGKLISSSLVSHLKATGAASKGGILIVNGSPTDAAAGLIKKGIHEGVDPSGIKVLAEYDTPNWTPSLAQSWVSGQISRFHSKMIGVVAANDGTGDASIAAFKAGGVNPVPPVTGNDAVTAAAQLIIAGDQYNTINKPIHIVATAAANAAYDLLKGKTPPQNATVFGTPSDIFTPFVVTQKNIKQQLIDSGLQKASAVCTPTYAAACAKLGIKG